jgi:hypothetical protein
MAKESCPLPEVASRPSSLIGEVPFPWGQEVPFPWSTISGLWSAGDAGDETFFRFSDVGRIANGERAFDVKEVVINPDGSETEVAFGQATAAEDEKVVRAIMTGGANGSYFLTIRAFNLPDECGVESLTTVVSIRYLNDHDEKHLLLSKKSDDSSRGPDAIIH